MKEEEEDQNTARAGRSFRMGTFRSHKWPYASATVVVVAVVTWMKFDIRRRVFITAWLDLVGEDPDSRQPFGHMKESSRRLQIDIGITRNYQLGRRLMKEVLSLGYILSSIPVGCHPNNI
jgi:hypothetical protein